YDIFDTVRRLLFPVVVLAATLSCNRVDAILEGKVAPNARLIIEVSPSTITLEKGAEQKIAITVRRVGDFNGPVTVFITGGPPGALGTVGPLTTVGAVSSCTGTFKIPEDVAVGVHT